MQQYHYDVSISRQKRFTRRLKIFSFIVVSLTVVGIAVISIDAFKQSSPKAPKNGAPSVTVVRPSVREFDSEYFTFTAPSNWKKIDNMTSSNTFVYVSYKGNLVEQQLTIYVNSPQADLIVTHALPVRIKDGKRIIPTDVTDHCNTASAVKKASQPVEVTIMNVKVTCLLDGTNYLVGVAEKEGDQNIVMKRADNTKATYNFVYRSSTVPPESLQLVNILNDFTPL